MAVDRVEIEGRGRSHLRVVRDPEPAMTSRASQSHELQPSESLVWNPKNPWSSQRPRTSLSSAEAVLYAATSKADLPRVDAEYKPEIRAFERMLAEGQQHDPLLHPRVVDAWHRLLSNPAISDRDLDSYARRGGIDDEGERYLLTRDDL